MKVDNNTIKHVASLARLNLGEKELEELRIDMENIISYVDKLNELDVSGIEPTSHIIPVKNVFRKDIKKESYDREEILKNAPEKENGCFLVPKIVE